MQAPEHLEVTYGAHSVAIRSVKTRRWIQHGPSWSEIFVSVPLLGGLLACGIAQLGLAPGAIVLSAGVLILPFLGGWLLHEGQAIREEALEITPCAVAIGGSRWSLDRIEHWEIVGRVLRIWIRLEDDLLKRYEIGLSWRASEQAWLAGVLQAAVRSNLGAGQPEAPSALRQMLERGEA